MSERLVDKVLRLAGKPTGVPPELTVESGDRIVAIGDSITQNAGYLRVIDAVLAQQSGVLSVPPILNVGVSGQKAEDMLSRFERDVVRHEPTVATLSVGINDVGHRLGEAHDEAVLAAYGRNVERMMEMARGAGIRFDLLAPTVIEEDPASEGNRRLAGYVAAGKAIAARLGCGYVDLHGLFLRAIANRQAPAASVEGGASEEGGQYFTRDGVHMEPAGDLLMAVGILRAWGVPDERIAATDVSGAFVACSCE